MHESHEISLVGLPLAHEMRHHGEVAGECIHGFAPGTCLICQTLEKPTATKEAVTKEAKAPRSSRAVVRAAGRPAKRSAGTPEPQSGPRVVPKEAPPTGSPAMVKVLGLVVGVIVVIVVAWIALHLVFAVLHIVELIGVAVIALYLGWVAGVHHGHKTAQRR